jgi:hypothetical protein
VSFDLQKVVFSSCSNKEQKGSVDMTTLELASLGFSEEWANSPVKGGGCKEWANPE